MNGPEKSSVFDDIKSSAKILNDLIDYQEG